MLECVIIFGNDKLYEHKMEDTGLNSNTISDRFFRILIELGIKGERWTMACFTISGKSSSTCRFSHSHPIWSGNRLMEFQKISPTQTLFLWELLFPMLSLESHSSLCDLGLVLSGPPTNPNHEYVRSFSYGSFSPCCCTVDARWLNISVLKNFHSASSREDRCEMSDNSLVLRIWMLGPSGKHSWILLLICWVGGIFLPGRFFFSL